MNVPLSIASSASSPASFFTKTSERDFPGLYASRSTEHSSASPLNMSERTSSWQQNCSISSVVSFVSNAFSNLAPDTLTNATSTRFRSHA